MRKLTTCYCCGGQIDNDKVIYNEDIIPFCSKLCMDKTHDKVNNVAPRFCHFCHKQIYGRPTVSVEWSQYLFCSWDCMDKFGGAE